MSHVILKSGAQKRGIKKSKMATASDALRSLVVQVQGLDIKDNEIGSGAYGMVHAVTVNGRQCIAKRSPYPQICQFISKFSPRLILAVST